MTTLITVDPGKHLQGIAVFQNMILLQAGIVEAASLRGMTQGLFALCSEFEPAAGVVEIPRVYQQRDWKGDPQDLIAITIRAGISIAALAPFCEPQCVHPNTWKGNVPKKIHNQRVLDKLNEVELEIVDKSGVTKTKKHNMIDAIGLGLWKLKR